MAGLGPAAAPTCAIADDLTLGHLVPVPVAGIDLYRTSERYGTETRGPPPGPARELLASRARHASPGKARSQTPTQPTWAMDASELDIRDSATTAPVGLTVR
jgi:hypothetical protein